MNRSRTTLRYPMTCYANAVACSSFFAALFIKTQPAQLALYWLGGLALLCAIVFLAMRK
jgi:hypothetical protein